MMLQHFEVRLTHLLKCARLMTHILGGAAVLVSSVASQQETFHQLGGTFFCGVCMFSVFFLHLF